LRLFSYRNKLRLKRLLIVVLSCLLVAALFVAGYYFYLQRYVVYTSDGAYLDLPWRQQSEDDPQVSQFAGGQLVMDVSVDREDVPEETDQIVAEAVSEIETPMRGYTVDPSTLSDPDTLLSAVDQDLAEAQDNGEEADITVMLTVKSNAGSFYYNSSLGTADDCAEITESLISELTSRDIRLVALLPAFADSAFALENQNEGLPISGGALWMDENGCYWVDPTSQTAQDQLVAICKELRRLGFSEVVFTDFAFPESSNIIYSSDYSRSELTVQTAEAVLSALSSSGLTLSFLSDTTESVFPAAALADRVYLSLDDGSAVSSAASLYQDVLEAPELQLVFLTDSRDTRFEDYGVLRPVS
jgi:hypothetical protein